MSALVTLPTLIAQVESSSRPDAMRFEPDTYGGSMITNNASRPILARIADCHLCSIITAKMIYSTSWGFFQLMGFVLYGELGYEQTVAAFMDDHDAQYALFSKFVQSKGINYNVDYLAQNKDARVKFGATYNGDGQAYATGIEAAMKHFNISFQD